MKKFVLAALIVGMGGAGVQTATAGGWSITGKVLTGVVAASVVSHAFCPRPCYYPAYTAYPACPSYGYGYSYAYPQPVAIAPAPMVAPAPVAYYAPAPVAYYAPAPVVYRQPCVVIRPPGFGVHVGVGPIHVGVGIR